MRANLSSTELLATEHTPSPPPPPHGGVAAASAGSSAQWVAGPSMSTPRHAFALAHGHDHDGREVVYACGEREASGTC
jgi:hypothetical protein